MAASEQGGIDDAVAERLPADPALRDAQVLIDWNAIGIAKSLEVDGFQTLTTNRAMPLMHLAVHDALNAIAPVYARHGEIGTDAEGHPVATVSQAAHDVLAEEYPDHAAAFAELHAQWLDEVPQGTAKEHGRELGAATAAATLDARADDGHDSEGSFSPREEPGAYRLTPPHEAPAGTGRAETEPLAMEAPDQFRPGPPLQIDSARYAEEFDEVNRTPRARNSAVYWGLGFLRRHRAHRSRDLHSGKVGAVHRRLDEPARQSIRRPAGRELHEDAQGRGRLPHRIRHLRRSRR